MEALAAADALELRSDLEALAALSAVAADEVVLFARSELALHAVEVEGLGARHAEQELSAATAARVAHLFGRCCNRGGHHRVPSVGRQVAVNHLLQTKFDNPFKYTAKQCVEKQFLASKIVVRRRILLNESVGKFEGKKLTAHFV